MKMNARLVGAMLTVLLAGLGVTQGAQASTTSHQGRVAEIRIENSSSNDSFTLMSLTSIGSCATMNGLALIKLPARTTEQYKSMISVLLAARLANKQVTAWVDDAVLTNGYCTIVRLS